MKIRNLFLSVVIFPCLFGYANANAYELFDKSNPVQYGVNVFDVSNVFTDIYTQLNNVSWTGKNINIAIESLENISSDAHIAATEKRVILVWRDTIVANYPKPEENDFNGFGQITTALVLKLRELSPEFKNLSENQMYKSVVDAIMRSIDQDGKYIFSKKDELLKDGKIITSVGIEGARDQNGYFRVHGIYKGSPADTSNIIEGDLISKINGQSVQNMSDTDLENEFSGFNSGTLKLVLLTSNGNKNVVLRRAAIIMADADIIYKQVKTDNFNSDEKILEIIVHNLTDSAVSIVNEALARNSNISGIVLDLRAAGGNDERSAAKMAGLFVGQNPVMRVVETAKSESEIIPGGSAIIDVPTVVLISNTTTGAAEALASAFYETKKGILVGTPSAGKARLATTIDLKTGGQLVLYNKAIKTGRGHDIEGRGVFPLVCLSNIRNDLQQGVFFVNVLSGDFKLQDFNKMDNMPAKNIRRGCPNIVSGEDEDLLSAGISAKILTDKNIYEKLMGE